MYVEFQDHFYFNTSISNTRADRFNSLVFQLTLLEILQPVLNLCICAKKKKISKEQLHFISYTV